MNAGRLRVEPLARAHLREVARLHVMRLTRDFSGWAGRGIMALFYRELLASPDCAAGFVAVHDGRVVGFAVAVADPRAIKRRVGLRWGWWLAVLALAQMVSRPRALLERWRRRGRESPRRPATTDDRLAACCPAPRIEFRGIVVDPAAHCPGAPLALMRARLAWAKAAGYRSIYFCIDPENQASIKLCQWAGARPVPDDTGASRRRFYMEL
jgi:RimJ/RimL family protein N-acetyltransferase